MDRGAWWGEPVHGEPVHGVTKSQTRLREERFSNREGRLFPVGHQIKEPELRLEETGYSYSGKKNKEKVLWFRH